MSHVAETFTFSKNNIDFTVNVMCAESNDGFADQWKLTDEHKGGVTIKNSDADRNSYKYAIPQQCSLAELTASFAAQGRENPSQEAYDSLQRQLKRDINASDYYFKVSAYAGSFLVLDDSVIGCGFDYSYDDAESLEETALQVWKDYGGEEEAHAEAIKEVRARLENIGELQQVIENLVDVPAV